MILTIGQTAKAVRLSKTSICKHIESGKISAAWNNDTKPPQREIDASEILRVYGVDVTVPPSRRATVDSKKPSVDTPLEIVLKAKDETISALKSEIERLAAQIETKDEQISAANRLLAAPKPDPYAALLERLESLAHDFAPRDNRADPVPVELLSEKLAPVSEQNRGIIQRIASVFTGQKARAA